MECLARLSYSSMLMLNLYICCEVSRLTMYPVSNWQNNTIDLTSFFCKNVPVFYTCARCSTINIKEKVILTHFVAGWFILLRKMCCYVIVTVRSLFWALLSITVCLAELSAFMSAHWLVGQPISPKISNESIALIPPTIETVRTTGLFLRCEQKDSANFMSLSDNCRVYAHSAGDIASPFWVATCIFMALAILFLFVVALFSVWALCFRSLGKKSIFSISGILQAIAGLLLIFSLVLFPIGWGSDKVKQECGPQAAAFHLGTCHIGWAYYAAMLGTLLSFFCAVLSNQAEVATGSESVENDIIDGKNPVCAL